MPVRHSSRLSKPSEKAIAAAAAAEEVKTNNKAAKAGNNSVKPRPRPRAKVMRKTTSIDALAPPTVDHLEGDQKATTALPKRGSVDTKGDTKVNSKAGKRTVNKPTNKSTEKSTKFEGQSDVDSIENYEFEDHVPMDQGILTQMPVYISDDEINPESIHDSHYESSFIDDTELMDVQSNHSEDAITQDQDMEEHPDIFSTVKFGLDSPAKINATATGQKNNVKTTISFRSTLKTPPQSSISGEPEEESPLTKKGKRVKTKPLIYTDDENDYNTSKRSRHNRDDIDELFAREAAQFSSDDEQEIPPMSSPTRGRPRTISRIRSVRSQSLTSGARKKKPIVNSPPPPLRYTRKSQNTVLHTRRESLTVKLNDLTIDNVTEELGQFVDPLLNYDGLYPLESWGPLDLQVMDAIKVTEGIERIYGYEEPNKAKHFAKLIRLIQAASYDEDGYIHNLARQDPTLFVAMSEYGLNERSALLKYRQPDNKVTDCAFVTFGKLAAKSQIWSSHSFNNLSQRPGAPSQFKVKSISVFPIRVEFARMAAAAQTLFAAYHAKDYPRSRIKPFPRLNIRFYLRAPNFGTTVRAADEDNRRFSATDGLDGDRTAVAGEVTENQGKYYFRDLLKSYMKRGALQPNDVVPIFDATAIFQGKEVDTHFDFANVGKVCPILNRELMEEDLVAIIHSVSRAEIKSEWSMQFGVYGVVLLATKI